MRNILLTSTALLLLGAIAPAGVQEVSIEFKEFAKLKGHTPYGSAYTQLEAKVPDGEWKLPELIGEKPLYCLAKLGDSEFLLVFDSQKEGEANYDRAYFDQNGNRDLTDDEPLDGAILRFEDDSFFIVTYEDHVCLDYQLDGETFPYVLGLQVSGQDLEQLKLGLPDGMELPEEFSSQSFINANLTTECCYGGRFELGERAFQVRLGDSDCDGRFDEVTNVPEDSNTFYAGGRIYAEGDTLCLTHKEKLTYEDQLSLGDHLVIGEQLFGVDVDILEGKLTLTEVTEGLLPLKLSHEPQRLVAHSKGFEHTIMMYEPGEAVELPADEYRLLSYSILGEGSNGDVWRLTAGATLGSPFIALTGSGGVLLLFGEPFTASVEIPEWAREMRGEDGKRECRIEFSVRGVGGEVVGDLSHISGTSSIAMSGEEPQRPLEPSYTIVKPDGEQAKKGSFEYG